MLNVLLQLPFTGIKHESCDLCSPFDRLFVVCCVVFFLFVCFFNVPATYVCVSQGRIPSDNCTCRRTEIEVADQNFCLNQSRYSDTGPTSPSADPISPDAYQGSHWGTNV